MSSSVCLLSAGNPGFTLLPPTTIFSVPVDGLCFDIRHSRSNGCHNLIIITVLLLFTLCNTLYEGVYETQSYS